MSNPLFTLRLSLDLEGQYISSINIKIDSIIPQILLDNFSLSEIFIKFPTLTPIEYAFLNFWQQLKTNFKKKEFILKAPFSANFTQFIGYIPTIIIFPNHKEIYITHSTKKYHPNLILDLANSSLSFQSIDNSLLLDSIYPLVIINDHIQEVIIPFNSNIITQLYIHKKTIINPYENSILIEEFRDNNSPLRNFLNVPEIIQCNHIIPVFEFYYNKQEQKYELGIFLESLINNKKELFPLNLEQVQQFILSNNPFVVSNNKFSLHISNNQAIYNKISKIIEYSFQNFYSILGEISDNKIITKDRANLFESFLPKISSDSKIYKVGNNKKLEFILIKDKLSLSITNSTKKLLFGNNDWLSINFEYDQNSIILSLNDLEKILQQGFIEIADSLISLPEEESEPIKKLLTLNQKKSSSEMKIHTYFLPWILSLYPNAEIPKEWQELKLFVTKNQLPDISLSPYTNSILRDYQRIGIIRLSLLHKFGFGVVLADEMGLGKTLQILALLDLHLKDGKALIVTPSALTLNWFAEIQKFYPNRFNVLIVDGSKQERHKKLHNINNHDIIITSYHMLGSDLELYKNTQFLFFIIDEAQHIKNKKAKRSKSVKSIQAHTRIAVSGTPLENNISELWSIFDFIMPEFLGSSKQFQQDYEDTFRNFDTDKRKMALKKLSQMTSPFIIRRTKKTVYKELPPKIEQTIITELTTKQKTIYLETLSRVRNHFFDIVEYKGFNQSRVDFLSALTKLRQIALHPALLYPELEELNSELYSSKISILFELLHEAFDSQHRVLVFSQFVSMLALIKKELDKQDIPYHYIDGKTQNRVQLSEEFNQGTIPVFLISLKAGGIGLNLTGADTVILFDPWWNPAVENQAIDRVHRIGQNKTVNVYRLMTKGTIEEKIYNLQRKKDLLFDNILQENDNFGEFSSDELLSLLNQDDSLLE